MTTLTLYSPAGAVARRQPLTRAARRLRALGFEVAIDPSARARHQRFAGDDDTRLAAIHRVAAESPDIALATRGGYGMTRLLDRIDWPLILKSVQRGTRWAGQSDLTAFQLGLLAHAMDRNPFADLPVTWAGPMACNDFGRADDAGGVVEITLNCFLEAMSGVLEAIGFRTERGFDGLQVTGTLWGGNLCMLNTLLGTRHFPRITGGILFLEDINEQPYRIERSLLQLHQAGVLTAQRAVVLGDFTGWQKLPYEHGYSLKTLVQYLRDILAIPLLTGLPFGHGPTKVTLPIGIEATLAVNGRNVQIDWGD